MHTKFKVGKKHIHRGMYVTISKRGLLKPAGPDDYLVGKAMTHLPSGDDLVILEYGHELRSLRYPCPKLARIANSFLPVEYVSEKMLPKA